MPDLCFRKAKYLFFGWEIKGKGGMGHGRINGLAVMGGPPSIQQLRRTRGIFRECAL
jgi:hypothetical protein